MNLQQRPEPWMCMPLAFAMALDVPVADLLEAIGHDGSEIVFPNLPEPLCRRCFHVQELILVALSRGLAVTPVELFPVLQPTEVSHFRKTVLYPDNNWRRFEETLRASRGVIDGTGSRHGHTVAYDHGRIYDPKGCVYDYSRLAFEAHQFYTRCAWRIDTIGERICE
jgi:hypothetical protein